MAGGFKDKNTKLHGRIAELEAKVRDLRAQLEQNEVNRLGQQHAYIALKGELVQERRSHGATREKLQELLDKEAK